MPALGIPDLQEAQDCVIQVKMKNCPVINYV
jgi:hypothetical protein